MEETESEGLGLSVLLYLGAICGIFVLLAMPIYWAIQPQIYQNPKLAQSNPLLNGPIVSDRIATRVPLAVLQPQTIADAETTALLNPKPKKATPAARPATRMARRDIGTPMAELRTEPARPAMFPFSLF